MIEQVMLKRVIYITWLSVALCFCWPISANSNRNQIIVFRFLQIFTIISSCLGSLPMFHSIYLHQDDIVIVAKSISIVVVFIQLIVQTTICAIKHDTLQHIIEEMITYIKEAKQYEKEIMQKYVAKCYILYGSAIIISYLTTTIFILGPIFLPVSLPFYTEFPLSLNNTAVYIIIYFHQCFFAYQCSATVCLSIFGALLLWFVVIRFECLIAKIQNISNKDMMVICIKKQLQIRRYAKEIANCLQHIIFYTIIATSFNMILAGIILIMNPLLIIKIQFMITCFTALIEVYLYAWPAQYMDDMSKNVSISAYNLKWYEQTSEMQQNILIMLIFQKPISLSINFLVPKLSLRSYCAID
ncbi:odorant receptor 67a-like [Apis dorsata]|uniref:odorant receptor 67a-like n=1 Tax=Apis dorsata TaxID=7462 RepID=UPI001292F917|nr:odorant receptor 67a-like [Apis dorsata]